MPDTAIHDELESISKGIEENVEPSILSTRLDQIEPAWINDTSLRARHSLLRGIVKNRLGLFADALAEHLHARSLYEKSADIPGVVNVDRELGLAYAWRGKTREAALSLIDALSASAEIDDATTVKLLIDAGRLNLEIGRFDAARGLLDRAAGRARHGQNRETNWRIRVSLAQALIGLGEYGTAAETLEDVIASDSGGRTRHVALVELARTKVRRDLLHAADVDMCRLCNDVADRPDSFEAIEVAEVDAELAMARGDPTKALSGLDRVIARYAEDDLAGREVLALVRRAEVLFRLDREDDASGSLLTALRRARSRGLVGHESMVRTKLAERSISPIALATPSETSSPSHSAERYVRRRALGKGGLGNVSAAYDLESGEIVAVKRLALSAVYDLDERSRILASVHAEVTAASRVFHPGVGRVYGLSLEDNGDCLLVREMIEGITLRDLIGREISVDNKLILLGQLVRAVDALHAATVVHRDLKPENIVLRDERRPVIIDFGASSWAASATNTSYSVLYAAPEQLASQPVDTRADLYALGIIAFEIFTGRRPQTSRPDRRPTWLSRRARDPNVAILQSTGCPPAQVLRIAGLLAHDRRRRTTMADLLVAFPAG